MPPTRSLAEHLRDNPQVVLVLVPGTRRFKHSHREGAACVGCPPMDAADVIVEAVAGWLDQQAPEAANGSRDFGRGYKHAATIMALEGP